MEPLGQGQCESIITYYHRGKLHKYASTIIQNIHECFVGGNCWSDENFGELWQQVCGKKVGHCLRGLHIIREWAQLHPEAIQ